MRGVRVCLQASLLALLLLLGACNLSLQVKEPYLELDVQAAYQSTDDITIHFKFTADEPALRARYTLSTHDTLIESGTTEPLSPGVEYERSIDLPGQFDEGKYLFRLVVQAERGGEYVDLTFLDKTAEFYVDHTAPDTAPVYGSRSISAGKLQVFLSHPELIVPEVSPVNIHYTLDGIVPTPDAETYNRNTGIIRPLSDFNKKLRAVAYDLAGNASPEYTQAQLWPDTERPAEPSVDLTDGNRLVEPRSVTVSQAEWSDPQGSPVEVFYTLDGTNPRSSPTRIKSDGSGVVLPFDREAVALRAVARDLAGNESSGELTRNYRFIRIESVTPTVVPQDYVEFAIIGFGFNGVSQSDIHMVHSNQGPVTLFFTPSPPPITPISINFLASLKYAGAGTATISVTVADPSPVTAYSAPVTVY